MFVYLDDIVIAAHPLLAEHALGVVEEGLAGCEFEPAPEKLIVWMPDGPAPPGAFVRAWATDGFKILWGFVH